MTTAFDNCQARFARRWGHLRQRPVRALAWLLDSPDLLDAAAPLWAGRVAELGAPAPAVADWLGGLDADPARLDAALGARPPTRLGLYAEKLLAFYFQEHGQLAAHGLQVRAGAGDTVGEFDFLLAAGAEAVEHIEFAVKFYLCEGADPRCLDNFVGPGLADSLGAKMRKIMGRQLLLGGHPAAQAVLPLPVARARALVKGWLFYRPGATEPAPHGIADGHCRGFWCALAEVDALEDDAFVLLPRLEWLAPFRAASCAAVLGRAELRAALADLPAPVLVAAVRAHEGVAIETARGFIVPDQWRARAARAHLPR